MTNQNSFRTKLCAYAVAIVVVFVCQSVEIFADTTYSVTAYAQAENGDTLRVADTVFNETFDGNGIFRLSNPRFLADQNFGIRLFESSISNGDGSFDVNLSILGEFATGPRTSWFDRDAEINGSRIQIAWMDFSGFLNPDGQLNGFLPNELASRPFRVNSINADVVDTLGNLLPAPADQFTDLTDPTGVAFRVGVFANDLTNDTLGFGGRFSGFSVTYNISVVPEPNSLSFASLICFIGLTRRSRQKTDSR